MEQDKENELNPGMLFKDKKTEQGQLRVMVEVIREEADKGAFAMNSDFRDFDFTVDKVLGKGPKRRSEAAHMGSEREGETMVVSGYVPENKLDALRSDHRIKYVSLTGIGEGLFSDTCPEGWNSGPCDCPRLGTPVNPKPISEVIKYLEVDKIWADGYRGQGIVVGVIDGGITAEGREISERDTSNPNWPGKLIKNVIGGSKSDWGTTGVDGGWHGNMCATDLLAIAPETRLFDLPSGSEEAYEALEWAIEHHQRDGTPQILTNSWGVWNADSPFAPRAYGLDINHPTTRKYLEAIDEGIIVLFAAGNCGFPCGNPSPARCGTYRGSGRSVLAANGHPHTITIGAVNVDEQYVSYSSQGPSIFGAEKPDFCSTTHFKAYYPIMDDGTSAATPIAAGVIALLKHAYPSLTHNQAKNILKETAKDIGPVGQDICAGSGIIRPKAAYDRLNIMIPRASP